MEDGLDPNLCLSQSQSLLQRDDEETCLEVEDKGSFPDQDIWSALPQDVIERVMLWLPMRSLIRSRIVSKGWDFLILSKGFSDMYARVPSQSPWLLMFPEKDPTVGVAYDPMSESWFNLHFSFLPCESRVVATAEGLVCLVPIRASTDKFWYVCNPISKSWRELPSPPGLYKLFFLVVGMLADQEASSFKIVTAGSELVAEDSEQFILATEMYDSATNRWTRGGSLLLDVPLSRWKAFSGGIMYCVTGALPYRVVAYNVNSGSWFEVRAPIPESLASIRLIDHRGRLHMVGGIGNHGTIRNIGIWKLEQSGTEWKEVDWMPPHLFDVFLISLSRRFACIGQGDLIYFSSKKCPHVLVHNLLKRSWSWMPDGPHLPHPYYHMLRGFYFQFQPRLHMLGGSEGKRLCDRFLADVKMAVK